MTTNIKKNILLGASAAAIVLGATALTPTTANAAACALTGAITTSCELVGNLSGDITVAASQTVLAQTGAVIDQAVDGASAGVGNLTIDLNVTNTGIIGATALNTLTVNSGKTLTLGAAASATNVAVNGTLVTAANTLTGAVTLGSAGALNNTNGATITGAINGTTAGVGTYTVSGANASTGGIIGGTAKLASVVANAVRLSVGHNITATGFTLTGAAGALQVDSAATLTGDINATTASTDGVLDINANTTVAGNIGKTRQINDVTVANATVLTVTGDTFSAADVDLEGATSEINLTGANVTLNGVIDGLGAADRGILDIDGNATINAEIGQTLAVDVVEIAAGKTATVNSNISSDDFTLQGVGSTIKVATTGKTLTGNINASTAGQGVLDIDQNTTVAGKIGNSAKLASVDVAAGKSLTVTVDGASSVDATAITVNAGSTLNLDSTTAAATLEGATTVGAAGKVQFSGVNGGVISTTINGAAANTGILDIDNTITLDSTGSIGATKALAAITIANTGKLTSSANVSANDITLQGNTAEYETGADGTVVTANINSTVAGEGIFDVNHNITLKGSAGTTTRLDDINITTGKTITFDVTGLETGFNAAGQATVLNADTLVFADAVGTQTAVTDTSRLFSYAVTEVAETAVVTATLDNTSLGQVQNGSKTALTPVLKLTAISADASNTLAGINTQAGLNSAAEKLSGDVSGAGAAAVASATAGALDTVSTHLADARNGNTGVAAGEGYTLSGYDFWAQAFGGAADQDTRDGVKGFESDTIGFAVGTDTAISETARVGVSLAYGQSDVDGDSAAQTQSDIDTYQATLYGTYVPTDNGYFVDGFLSYALNNTEANRNGVVAGSRINADYDTSVYRAVAKVGKEYETEIVKLTPSFALDYAHISTEDYTETGGAGRLNVDADAQNIFVARGELEADETFQLQNGSHVRPFASVGAQYDFVGDEYSTTSTYAGTTGTFTTTGADVAQASALFGTGVDWEANDGSFILSAEANSQVKEDFFGYSGSVTARWKF